MAFTKITAAGIDTSGTITTQSISVSGVSTVGSLSIGATSIISAGRQLQNIASLDATTTATIESAITNAPNTFTDLSVTGISTLGVTSATSIVVSSGSTFTNGPVFIGAATSTGTASQRLQVTGGAYVSGSVGIGVTNPAANAHGTLQVNGTIGLAPNSQIRQWTSLDSGTLQVFATQFVAGLNNSDSYGYSGGGLIGAVSNGDGITLLDIGRSSSSALGRFKIVNTIGGNISLSLANSSSTTLYTDTGSGSVGIGTRNPTSKLHVQGNVLVSGVSTSLTSINTPFYTNPSIITSSYTVPINQNSFTAGPVGINTGITISVSSGSYWKVI